MNTATSSNVNRRTSKIIEERKYPGSGQKPITRRSFRTPIQTVPLKSDGSRPERSASKSFVLIPPDQGEKETPRSLIQGLVADSKTQPLTQVSKKRKLSMTPVEKDNTFKVPKLTDMVLRNQMQALLKAPDSTPSTKYTPRTNIWNLIMDDVETDQAERTQSVEKTQASKSRRSELQKNDWGQRVTLSPLHASHQINSTTPEAQEKSTPNNTPGVRTRKRFILEQVAKVHEANMLSQPSTSQQVGQTNEGPSASLAVNLSNTREKMDVRTKLNSLHDRMKTAHNKNTSATPTQEALTTDLSFDTEGAKDQSLMSHSEQDAPAVGMTVLNSIGPGSTILTSGKKTPAVSKKKESWVLSHASKVNNDDHLSALGDDLPAQQPAASVYDIIDGSTSEDEQNSKTTGSVSQRMTQRKRRSSSSTLVNSRKNLSQLTIDQKHTSSTPPNSSSTRSKLNKTNTGVITPTGNITASVTHGLRSSTPVPRRGFLHSTKVHETNSSHLSTIDNNFLEYSHITDLSPIRPVTRFQKHKDMGEQQDLIHTEPSDKNQEDTALDVASRNQEYNDSDDPSRNENYNEPDPALANKEHTTSEKIQEHPSKITHSQPASGIDVATSNHESDTSDVAAVNKASIVGENRLMLEDHGNDQEGMTTFKDHKSISKVSKDRGRKDADAMNPQQQNEDDSDRNFQEESQNASDNQEEGQEASMPGEHAEYTELPSGLYPLTTPDLNLINRQEIPAAQLQHRQSTSKVSSGAKPRTLNQTKPNASQARKPRLKPTAKLTALPRKSVKFFAERHSSMKLSPDAIDEIMEVSEIFWDDTFKALERYALHAGRKVITDKDVILLMKTQRLITGTEDLYNKIREYLPMELRTQLIPCAKL